ncbi:MAG: GNAT family N-acetyltransferase [Chloroflexota bacterium]
MTIDVEIMRQVDRSEIVDGLYCGRQTSNGFGLELQKINQDPSIKIPSWSEEGMSSRSKKWQQEIEIGGHMLTASKAGKTVGFGIIGPKHADGSIELVALFVSSEVRKSGIGTLLFRQLEAMARMEKASSLLIYSNPTESAVDFYRRQNCEIVGIADKSLVTRLPWDVVFAKPFESEEKPPNKAST